MTFDSSPSHQINLGSGSTGSEDKGDTGKDDHSDTGDNDSDGRKDPAVETVLKKKLKEMSNVEVKALLAANHIPQEELEKIWLDGRAASTVSKEELYNYFGLQYGPALSIAQLFSGKKPHNCLAH